MTCKKTVDMREEFLGKLVKLCQEYEVCIELADLNDFGSNSFTIGGDEIQCLDVDYFAAKGFMSLVPSEPLEFNYG